jgi:hypothetical protein
MDIYTKPLLGTDLQSISTLFESFVVMSKPFLSLAMAGSLEQSAHTKMSTTTRVQTCVIISWSECSPDSKTINRNIHRSDSHGDELPYDLVNLQRFYFFFDFMTFSRGATRLSSASCETVMLSFNCTTTSMP